MAFVYKIWICWSQFYEKQYCKYTEHIFFDSEVVFASESQESLVTEYDVLTYF